MNMIRIKMFALIWILSVLAAIRIGNCDSDNKISAEQLAAVKKLEQKRIAAIQKVVGSVVAIYGESRQGGGSGVIIDPSGIALTNHHVIEGAGVKGWGGLSDGKLYPWELIGTDPGGDVSIIQMIGDDDFPFTPLADSDKVQVGDWSLAMGNPFLLTEDQAPTVTLGIVSGVKRYQPGAGLNKLVYGNCIQTDSSINPGNSGGPLFNLSGRVIGINGRGSFKERGRVNVGLGYAISSNQIKNFIPELLATKLVEHGTLDANFSDRDGKVVCSNLFEDSKLYKLGVRPGDELLEFEGEKIETANQFTNLICTLPEDWPASLLLRQKNGKELAIDIRLYGLPYQKPSPPKDLPPEKDRSPEQKEQIERAMAMIDLLSAVPGTVRLDDVNLRYAKHICGKWTAGKKVESAGEGKVRVLKMTDSIVRDGTKVGTQEIWIADHGGFQVRREVGDDSAHFIYQQENLYSISDGESKKMSLVEMKLCPEAVQAIGIAAANDWLELNRFGKMQLDGSDKAQQRKAYRLKMLDEDEDAFYVWLSMQDRESNEEVSLLKAGADMDCQHDFGGISFSDWQNKDGWSVSGKRSQIKGLGEKVTTDYVNQSVHSEWVDVDSLWQLPGSVELESDDENTDSQ